MAYTTINKSGDYFNTKLYTGNGSTNAITGVGFQPDWTWIKSRNLTKDHMLFDAVRGVQKSIRTNNTNAEDTSSDYLTAFGTDGFTVGNNGKVNTSSDSLVSWNWKANGAGSSNTDGTITATVSANTTAGFSIVKYTGTGSAGTVGHGLGVAPKMIIVKCLDTAKAWTVYHSALGSSAAIFLEQTSAATTSNTTYFGGTDPTTSVFSIGSSTNVTNSGDEFIAYCFAEKTGYSKFGTYTGNNSNDGTFIYTGFKPAFVITKSTTTAEAWNLMDNKRKYTYNPTGYFLYPNKNIAEAADTQYSATDFVSNGFKLRNSHGQFNGTATHLYMAFASAPLVGSNNVPCTAA